MWGSGFLPSHFQGVEFRAGAEPVPYISSPDGLNRQQRRSELDVINSLAKTQYAMSGDPEILSRVTQYEMAYRMQDSIPRIADISSEPKHIVDMYGPDVHTPGSFARNCLLTRRLVENGVKFVQLVQVGWDHHARIVERHPPDCMAVDQPTAALIADLKQRGLLDDTLVIWGSEFGRTSYAQGTLSDTMGRDHHGGCFTYLLAGGGVKGGVSYGETDEFSYNIVKNPVTVHDLHATMLHLLGVDHKQLTYHYQGRDFRLTDVSGEVVKRRSWRSGRSRRPTLAPHDGYPLLPRPLPCARAPSADRHFAAGRGAGSGVAPASIGISRAGRHGGLAARCAVGYRDGLARLSACGRRRIRRARRVGSSPRRHVSRRPRARHLRSCARSCAGSTTKPGLPSLSRQSPCSPSPATSAATSRTAKTISRFRNPGPRTPESRISTSTSLPLPSNSAVAAATTTTRRKAASRSPSYSTLLKGGEKGAVIVPGKVDESDLVRRISLPSTDEDFMPQDGKTPLNAEQTEAIKQWVALGAPRTAPYSPPRVANAQTSKPAAATIDVPPPDPAALDALEANGFVVRAIAVGSPLVQADFTANRTITDADLDALARIGPQLHSLNLRSAGITDAQLTKLASLETARPAAARAESDYRCGGGAAAPTAGTRVPESVRHADRRRRSRFARFAAQPAGTVHLADRDLARGTRSVPQGARATPNRGRIRSEHLPGWPFGHSGRELKGARMRSPFAETSLGPNRSQTAHRSARSVRALSAGSGQQEQRVRRVGALPAVAGSGHQQRASGHRPRRARRASPQPS